MCTRCPVPRVRCPLRQLTVDAECKPCYLALRMLASFARIGLVDVMMKTLQGAAEDVGESVREGVGVLGVGVGVAVAVAVAVAVPVVGVAVGVAVTMGMGVRVAKGELKKACTTELIGCAQETAAKKAKAERTTRIPAPVRTPTLPGLEPGRQPWHPTSPSWPRPSLAS